MTESNIASTAIPIVPTWKRVPELADLVEIFDPGVQVCSWQREIDPAIEAYLSQLQQAGEVQALETVCPAAQPNLGCLPEGLGRSSLIDDLSFLRDVVCELLGCGEAGLRMARVGHAMCPGWHVDHVSIRLVCTYLGPGTQWLDDQDVDRDGLQSARTRQSTYVQAIPGEIVLLKGDSWQENEAFGAVHRSPELDPSASLRTLVTLDPLWRE
jgi:hypothetical protein